MLTKLLNWCLISVKLEDPEVPTHKNEDANVMCYLTRDRGRQKYLDDYVKGKDIDYAVDDTANSTIDFCYRLANVLHSYQGDILFPMANEWKEAMSKQLNVLWDNQTSQLTPLPPPQWGGGGGG